MPERKPKTFTEAAKCEEPGTCKLGGFCLRAEVVKNEIAGFSEGNPINNLKRVVDNSTCNHGQARRAVLKARILLGDNS